MIRQQALHQRKLEQVVPTCLSPSKVYLDSNAPASHPHLAKNAKRLQIERDRQLDIYHQNQRLANKMDQIMNRQENIVLAASSTRSRLPQRSHKAVVESMPRVPSSGGDTDRAQTPGTVSPGFYSPQKPVHSPAHTHMPGIRIDSTQTPLLDCHLSPEYAMSRGDACKKPTLVNRAVQKRRQNAIEQENRRMKDRLAQLKPYYNTKKWDGEWQQHAHKFGHLRQDCTVGYLLPHPKASFRKIAPSSREGGNTTRERSLTRGGVNSQGLPSLDNRTKRNSSRAGRLRELQQHRSNSCAGQEDGAEDEDDLQVRDLFPCLLLEATTRQGVEVSVNELQIELTRSGIAELGDRGLMVRGSWKDGILGELLVNYDTLEQVAQIVDDLEIMIKLETVSQIPNIGNSPSLSTLLTDDELQKLLVGVVQQLRFQVAPDMSSSPQLLISWALPIKDGVNRAVSKSPKERSRPRTCPSTIVSENESQRQVSEIQTEDYPDDFNSVTFRDEADTNSLETEKAAVRYKTATLLNLDERRWRTVVCKESAWYLVSSWFEDETGILTIKTTGVGNSTRDVEVPLIEIAYSITDMKELLLQLDGGIVTVPELLKKTVTPLLP